MKDTIVFITGAKGGLGTFVTQKFLATGATVIGASRSIAKEDFPSPNFVPLSVDFIRASAVHDAMQSTIARHRKLDVLVHLLGGFAGGPRVEETDDVTWEQMRDLNLTSAFYVLREQFRTCANRAAAALSLSAVLRPLNRTPDSSHTLRSKRRSPRWCAP